MDLELGSVCETGTLRASLSGTFLRRKDVVDQCLEYDMGRGDEPALTQSVTASCTTPASKPQSCERATCLPLCLSLPLSPSPQTAVQGRVAWWWGGAGREEEGARGDKDNQWALCRACRSLRPDCPAVSLPWLEGTACSEFFTLRGRGGDREEARA